ncbi:MAG: glycosyltransferase family 4 protein [Rhodothermaceae bacterium]|nr:glycosyltransferase family 4 protein [Rhodothermaceae bacterium]MXZ59051.1 glycosyltransferase family 4 protein [Rhodothermaceae bacterium]MYB91221.1 glycosyltransferase family 4 protein [Rhodothermaceae bacterium]MYD69003.1 glycosyltransferase family 4 protein [Rhodothermaceae bacterium]MYG43950.1 glycosyltransferase family 4 protein [Rhodothermaceae bacterium]
MRVLIHDFGAYAFPVTLSQALQDRGHDVGHAYCDSLVTTPHNVCDSPADFTLLPVQTSRPLNKYNLVQRWIQEQEYGRLAARVILNFNPDIVISANAPLSAQERILRSCKQNGIPFVFWLQDLIGLATSRVLKSKLPLISSVIGRYFQSLEGRLLRRSDAVISITEDFTPALQKFGIIPDRCYVIENWGTLDRFQGNPSIWAQRNKLNQRPILLYAGTLSMKHNPAILLHLAQQVGSRAQIIVVSQGAGADWLTKVITEHNLDNLTVLPYQEADQLPAMYASAQLLLVLLTEDAGQFSVPSKVLTCLCAGRPVLAAIPKENLAARIIEDSGAGFIIDPNDHVGFVQKAQLLLDEPELCQAMGESARRWADEKFEIGKITDQFEHVLKQASA